MASVAQGNTAPTGFTTALTAPADNIVVTPLDSTRAYDTAGSLASTISNADGSDQGNTAQSLYSGPGAQDTTPPVVVFNGSNVLGSKTAAISIDVTDAGSGLTAVFVQIGLANILISGDNPLLTVLSWVPGNVGIWVPFQNSSTVTPEVGPTNTVNIQLVPDLSWFDTGFNVIVYGVDRAGNVSTVGTTRFYSCPSADVTGPTMSGCAPAAGSSVAATDPLQFDLTDPLDLYYGATANRRVEAVFADGTVEPIIDVSGSFVAPYDASSTQTGVSNGIRFVLRRTGGWPVGQVTIVAVWPDALDFNVGGGEYSVVVPDATAPTFAGATSADTPTTGSLTVHWAAGTDVVTAQGSLVYDVAAALSAPGCTGGNFAAAKIAASLPGATSVVIGGLTQGTTYFFCVRCRDAAGNEDANSVTVSATTTVPVAPDTTPPAVANMAPSPGTPLARLDPIFFDVTDETALRRVIVAARFDTSGLYEMVHDGNGFARAYAQLSTRTAIAGGWRYRIRRGAGWPEGPNIVTFALDTSGNET